MIADAANPQMPPRRLSLVSIRRASEMTDFVASHNDNDNSYVIL